jgi:primary-amine oxidase
MMKNPKCEEERRLEEELLIPILMGEHVIKLAEEAKSSKVEC